MGGLKEESKSLANMNTNGWYHCQNPKCKGTAFCWTASKVYVDFQCLACRKRHRAFRLDFVPDDVDACLRGMGMAAVTHDLPDWLESMLAARGVK